MRNECVEFSVFAEKVYKAFLDLIKHELDIAKAADINSMQAFILLNIDNNTVTMSEIINRGYYIGSNASYNIKRMISNGYLTQKLSEYDKRSFYLNLTNKGETLLNQLNKNISKHTQQFEKNTKDVITFKKASDFLSKVENYWKDILNKNPN